MTQRERLALMDIVNDMVNNIERGDTIKFEGEFEEIEYVTCYNDSGCEVACEWIRDWL